MDQKECLRRFFQGDTQNLLSIDINPIQTHTLEKSIDSSQELSQSQCSTASENDDLSLSQLTIEEQQPLNIPPFFNITPREIPISPHYVIEEEFSQNPWAMFVATIFLTKTSGRVARRYMKAFFHQYPTPYHVIEVNPQVLECFFENLGLKKRAIMIWKLSYQFVSARWRRASDLCGVGKYGEDAYRIFCLGQTDLDPSDRYLRLYLDWLRQHEFIEEAGVIGSEMVIEDPVLKYYRLTLRDCD